MKKLRMKITAEPKDSSEVAISRVFNDEYTEEEWIQIQAEYIFKYELLEQLAETHVNILIELTDDLPKEPQKSLKSILAQLKKEDDDWRASLLQKVTQAQKIITSVNQNRANTLPSVSSFKDTTECCKKLIVEYCQTFSDEIRNAFEPALPDSELKKSFDVKNWKRREKQKWNEDSTCTERSFDCTPFDDQLRGYVISRGNKVLQVYVQGE